MAYYSIQGSADRWFWCVWLNNPEQKPEHSGYAVSKDDALAHVANIAPDAEKLTASYAKRWRGVNAACRCGSTVMQIGAGKAQHHASLLCAKCGAFQKWISFEQSQQIEGMRRAG